MLSDGGFDCDSDVLAAVEWVTSTRTDQDPNNDIQVVNISLGGSNSPALCAAISNSVAAEVVYVVAAGNSAIDAANSSPANCGDAITVSALADFDGQPGGLNDTTVTFSICTEYQDDSFACFSNFGSAVDIMAPGVSIESTWIGGAYNTISGTSMASPHVAGAAARYLMNNPNSTPAQVRDALVAAGECADGSIHGGNGCSTEWPGDPDADTPSLNEPLLKVGSPGVSITTVSLFNGVVDTAYSQTLAAIGGTTPYT